MENKQISILKTRLSEVEKLHNRLTAIVVHLYHDNMRMKKYLHNQESINVSTIDGDDDEVDRLVINNKSDSNDRANRILEELKKVHES
jgi:hypothetical protein